MPVMGPATYTATQPQLASPPTASTSQRPDQLREAFDQFVGEAFYGQLLASMRKGVGKPAYFHGGRAEEVFRGQLDQQLAKDMTEAGASHLTDSMYQLFTLGRAG